MIDLPPLATDFPLFQNGIYQIGIIVQDIDRAVENYHRLLGIAPWTFYTYGRPLVKEMSYYGRPADYRMRIALAWMGELQIELIEPLSGESIYADFVRQHGYGLHHVAVIVPDRLAALDQARAAGFEVSQDGRGYGLDGDGSYTYLDTEAQLGITLEFVEVPRRRVAPEKVFPPAEPDSRSNS